MMTAYKIYILESEIHIPGISLTVVLPGYNVFKQFATSYSTPDTFSKLIAFYRKQNQ